MNNTIAALIAGSLLALSSSASADDVRIYSGVRRQQVFSYSAYAPETLHAYFVLDNTTSQFAFVMYYKNRSHYEETHSINVNAIEAASPAVNKASRVFIYSSSSDASVPVNTYRFRSTSKPLVLPISSSSSQLTAPKLSYGAWFFAFAAYNFEETGEFTYNKRLTILSNDANKNLTDAVNLVLDDLRQRDVID